MKKLFLALMLFCSPAFADGLILPPSAVGVAPVGQIPGTSLGVDACNGCVGEYIYSLVSVSPVSLTNGVYDNMTSILLTPGDWDVTAGIGFIPATSTSVTQFIASITQTSCSGNVNGTSSNSYAQRDTAAYVPGNGQQQTLTPPTVRVYVLIPTNVYVCVRASFTSSTMTARGILSARRVR